MLPSAKAPNQTTDPFSDSLEKFCIRHSVVLLDNLRTWRTQHPEQPFEELLLRNYQAIHERQWQEIVASEPSFPTLLPAAHHPALPPSAVTTKGQLLAKSEFALILLDRPVMVIGLVNPFRAPTISSWMANNFPNQPFATVVITPHNYVFLAAACARGSAQEPIWDEDKDQWATALGYNGDTYADLPAVVEDLWTQKPLIPTVPAHFYDFAKAIPNEDNALLLSETLTRAWILTPRASDTAQSDRLIQKLGRSLITIAVGPRDFARICKNIAAPQVEAVKINDTAPLVIQDWGISTTTPEFQAVLFQKIMGAAVRMGASDIHLEPKEEHTRIRFRVDGGLIEQAPISSAIYNLLLRHAKKQGEMDHDHTGQFQDGSGTLIIQGTRYDQRYAVIPAYSPSGECDSVTIRIHNSVIPQLTDLHLPEMEMKILNWFLQQDSGMLICCGQTGSGKTTTLYACLAALDQPDIKIITIEQPVEKFFSNSKQINLKHGSGRTFEMGLRAAMRDDPDIIMLGEIRDRESAENAVQAALTGHLVLTTLHANDAVSAIPRLCSPPFNIAPLALATALKLVISQRLLRRLCPHCRTTRSATHEELRGFPDMDVANPVISAPVGCPSCRGTGYAGRQVIMEMFPLDSPIVAMLEEGKTAQDLRRENVKRGFLTLMHQATRLAFTGEITMETARSFLPISSI